MKIENPIFVDNLELSESFDDLELFFWIALERDKLLF